MNMYTGNNAIICSRRKFIYDISCDVGFAALAINGMATLSSCGNSLQKREEKSASQKAQNTLGVALVGLGGYSSGELAPSLKETEHCYLAGIVISYCFFYFAAFAGVPVRPGEWVQSESEGIQKYAEQFLKQSRDSSRDGQVARTKPPGFSFDLRL